MIVISCAVDKTRQALKGTIVNPLVNSMYRALNIKSAFSLKNVKKLFSILWNKETSITNNLLIYHSKMSFNKKC